jgi:hypothetical protein
MRALLRAYMPVPIVLLSFSLALRFRADMHIAQRIWHLNPAFGGQYSIQLGYGP